jgi:nucleoside-diphosphate-sugar epimerase
LGSPDFLVTCLRFATACGPSPRLRLDLVLNDFVASAVAAGEIHILSDGTAWRPLIDVRDMARAIEWAALRRNEARGGSSLVVNVGRNDWNWRVRGLADAVAKAIPRISVRVDGGAQPDARSYRVDFGLFKSLAPLYQPELTVSDTIVDLKDSLERAGFHDPCFRTSRFARLHVLARLIEKGLVDLQRPMAVAAV